MLFLLHYVEKPVVWKLVQQRSAHNNCVYSNKNETWKNNLETIKSINSMENIEEELIEERGQGILMKNLLRNNEIEITDKGSIKGIFIIVYNAVSKKKSSGRIIKRTNKLLFISWKSGIIDIYQNIGFAPDSVPVSIINNCIIESGRQFGNTIKYCH
jgi:hypothetical protein